MSFLSPGYSYGNPFVRPSTEVYKELYLVNKGSIYDMLTKDFSVYKRVADISVQYRDILNNNGSITFVAPPDSLLPDEVKGYLLTLDRAEATKFLSSHTMDKAVKWLDGHVHQTRNGAVSLARVGNSIVLPKGNNKQNISLLSDGNFLQNGVVYVIDQPIVVY